MAQFGLMGFAGYAKDLEVAGPTHAALTLDWDDVDHAATALEFQKMCRILNDHWDDPQYAIALPEFPECDSEDEEAQQAYEDALEALDKDTDRIMESLVIIPERRNKRY